LGGANLGPAVPPREGNEEARDARRQFDARFLAAVPIGQDTLGYRETFQHPKRAVQLVPIWPALRLAKQPPPAHHEHG
jgi:hypothetical protein